MSKPTPHIEEPFQTIANGDGPRLLELLRDNPDLAKARNEKGDSPILYAAYRGHHRLVELLVDAGAEMDVFEAAVAGNGERVRALVAESPDLVKAYSHDGWTLLHLAAHFNRRDIAEYLLKHGADAGATSRKDSLAPGNTPLHAACASGHYDMAVFLLGQGAKVNATQENGMTPLHIAAAGHNVGLVQLLLEQKANPKAKDNEGRTPLAIAEQYERNELVDMLKNHVGG
ncbi:MAG: ankyrin repeat domain-containing protein [Candidatus Hydrogenedentes bacterium]|nr:ankyrin repeat domain-containing protein [Candidatus Hydrogenedentota bacterium]